MCFNTHCEIYKQYRMNWSLIQPLPEIEAVKSLNPSLFMGVEMYLAIAHDNWQRQSLASWKICLLSHHGLCA